MGEVGAHNFIANGSNIDTNQAKERSSDDLNNNRQGADSALSDETVYKLKKVHISSKTNSISIGGTIIVPQRTSSSLENESLKTLEKKLDEIAETNSPSLEGKSLEVKKRQRRRTFGSDLRAKNRHPVSEEEEMRSNSSDESKSRLEVFKNMSK